MSGPIVRSAPSKKFSQNWDSVFGKKASAAKKPSTSAGGKRKAGKKKAAKKKI